jgi:hypothetical protein
MDITNPDEIEELQEWQLKRRVQELEFEKKCVQLMEDWGNICNGGRGTSLTQGLLRGFRVQHRTLQQGIVRSFVDMLLEWRKGEKSHNVDMRNEASWEFAGKLDDQNYFPFI